MVQAEGEELVHSGGLVTCKAVFSQLCFIWSVCSEILRGFQLSPPAVLIKQPKGVCVEQHLPLPLPLVLETSGPLWDGEEPLLFPLPSDLARGSGSFGLSCVQQSLVCSVGPCPDCQ